VNEFGAQPELPLPEQRLIPTVHIAPAQRWPSGTTPVTAQGLRVQRFADGLTHPRWLYVLPNGDVLVAETNAPDRPDDRKGIRGWFMKRAMTKAGAAVPSPNRLILLRDADHDGVADQRTIFLRGLNSPFGIALVGHDLYVANTDALMRFEYKDGATSIEGAGTKVVDLPAGPINHHWTKNVIASPDGSRLYVTVGSNSNAGERGLENEHGRAAIWELSRADGRLRVFATGLRNPNGLAFEPQTGALWTVVNERDELGDRLVPDYLTSVRDGGFYGWPFVYYGDHADPRMKDEGAPAPAAVPDYALGSHTASLGLAFNAAPDWPAPFAEGAFVGQHGSWNRSEFSGYKVVFVPFRAGRPNGSIVDVLTGFISESGSASGRPVGVVTDGRDGLLVADDVGNTVWRVSPGGVRTSSLGR